MPSRRRALLLLLGAVALGLAVQPLRALPGTDLLGTLAYAGAAVGAVAVLLPRRGPLLPGAVGTTAACAVELAQLSGVPAELSARAPVLALLLGTTFSVVDLAALAAGGLLGTLVLTGRRTLPEGLPTQT